jgi:hypothetical protein
VTRSGQQQSSVSLRPPRPCAHRASPFGVVTTRSLRVHVACVLHPSALPDHDARKKLQARRLPKKGIRLAEDRQAFRNRQRMQHNCPRAARDDQFLGEQGNHEAIFPLARRHRIAIASSSYQTHIKHLSRHATLSRPAQVTAHDLQVGRVLSLRRTCSASGCCRSSKMAWACSQASRAASSSPAAWCASPRRVRVPACS